MTDLVGQDLGIGDRLVDANIRLRAGELVAIVGPNGSGKTSLLRLLAGQRAADRGSVLLDGTPIGTLHPRERARRLAYLPQRTDLAWPVSVSEMVALGRYAFGHGRVTPEDRAAVATALAEVGCTHLANRSTARLSGGELALAAIARIFAGAAPLMLLDEPTAALDPARQHQIMGVLRAKAAQGHGVAVVLHQLNLAARYADRIIWMKDGRIVGETGRNAADIAAHIRSIFEVEPETFSDVGVQP